jgi:hypothetical protein
MARINDSRTAASHAGVSAQLFNGLGVFYNHPSHRIKGSDQGT